MADSSGFTEYGLVSSVVYQQWGSELVAAASIGATTLTVDSTVDFDDAGGTLDLNGEHLEYTATDEDAGTITLAGALVTAAAEGDFVGVVEAGAVKVDYLAQVSMGEGEDVEVEIAVEDRDLWPEGQYEVDVPVVVSPDLSALKLAPGQVPLRDASYLDPTTIPEPIPTVPPDAPVLTVRPLTRGFMVTVLNPVSGVEYLLHAEAEPFDGSGLVDYDFALSAATTRYITAMPDGTPLNDSTFYNWTIIGHNAAGYGLSSNGVASTVLAKEDSSTIAELAVDLLSSGEFTAGMAVLGSIAVGTITIDPTNGILAPLANGGVFHIPVNGTPARFDGEFIARSLNVEGSALFKGLAQVLGTLRLAGKVPDPIVAPGAYAKWNSVAVDATDIQYAHGLVQRIGTAGDWVTVISVPFYGTGITTVNKTTGVSSSPVGAILGFLPDGGITSIGSDYYMLGRDYNSGRDGAWWVYKLNSSFAKTGEFAVSSGDTSTMTDVPTIGNDGTDLVIAWANSTSTYAARAYTTAGVGGTTTTLTHNLGARSDLAGVYKGSADFGAARYVVARYAADPLVFNTSGVRQTANEWARAGNSETRGLYWDGTRFRHLDPNGIIWDYATTPTSVTYDVAYEFASQSGLRTLPSPRRTFVCPIRARLAFDCPPPPEAGTPGTIADRVQFLVANSAGGTLRVQVSPAAGVTTGSIETYNGAGATASGSNTFSSGGSVGTFAAEVGGFTVDGSSNGSVGTGTFRTSVDNRVTAIAPDVTMNNGSVGTAGFRTSVDARVSAVGPGLTMTTGDVGTGAFRTSVDARVSAVGPGLTMTTGSVGTGNFRDTVDARVTAIAPGVTMAGGSVGTGAFRDSVDARVAALALAAETTATLSASGNYTGTINAVKHGTMVLLSGSIVRASSFSSTFEDTGATLPVGMRPSGTVILPASNPWNSTVQYQYQVLSTGVIQIRMTAANGNAMSITGAVKI